MDTSNVQIENNLKGRSQRLGLVTSTIISLCAFVGIFLGTIYVFNIIIFGRVMSEVSYIYLILSLFMPITFLKVPLCSRDVNRLPWYDILLALVSFAIPFYFSFQTYAINLLAWEIGLPIPEFIAALCFMLIVLEGCRRTVNLFYCIFVLFVMLYPLFSKHMPGIFQARSYSLHRIISAYMVGGDGLLGLPMVVLCTILLGFLVFATALTVTGAGDGFISFAKALLGARRGGMAKVSVLSSALVASISGSASANVLTTGSFTIPAMKREGYPATYAAAIESCASTGGVLMPPVMGAVAFILAYFLDIPYYRVCIAAIIPSLLYYFSLMVQVDAYAARNGLMGVPKNELPSLREALKEISIYLFAIIVLIYLLFYLRREAQAPFIASALLFIIASFRKKTRVGFKGFFNFLERAGEILGSVMPIMGGIGFIIAALYLTGLADSLAVGITTMAGDSSFLLIILCAISSFVLGMGLTVSACYVLLAILIAPAIVQRGFDPLAVHLFLMYCAMLSYITPPVAIASYVAASIAQAPPLKTGFLAMRLGILLFFLPLLFVYNPAFILHDTPLAIVQGVITAIAGIALAGSGIEGYMIWIGKLGWFTRMLCITSGILLVIPSWEFELAGAGLFFIFLSINKLAAMKKAGKFMKNVVQG